MKKLLIPVVAVLLTVGTSAGWAWSHVTGSITSIDPASHKIVLSDGKTYTVKSRISLNNLAVGDKVSVNTDKRHTVNKVTKM